MHFRPKLIAYVLLGAVHALVVPQIESNWHARSSQPGALGGLTSGLLGQLDSALQSGNTNSVISLLRNLSPGPTPTTVAQVTSVLQKAAQSTSQTIIDYDAYLIAQGILSGTVGDLISFAQGLASGQSSSDNVNRVPTTTIYPKSKPCDAPYSVPESQLRSAIYIPPTFTYGVKRPVILFPGTGNTGYITFAGNFIPLLTNVSYADPVWVNVPGLLLDDAQINSEYAAYAMNYIASITKRKDVGVIAWSQGNLNCQWAYKYWPSTRGVVTDHIAISADYAGTVFANAATLLVPQLTNDPSVLQQRAGSQFVTRLREGGGDSAYVPTTSVYSGFFDEIVEPQQGNGASAFLKGATNVEVQTACAGKGLAGTLYTHESMLVNPLAFALAKDALTHDGSGQMARLEGGLSQVCLPYLAPGLKLDDLLLTENAILVAGLALLLYPNKVAQEPVLKGYATPQTPQRC